MAGSISRLQLLRRAASDGAGELRPPFALAESAFLDNCGRGNACVAACSEKILLRGPGGYPQVDFRRGACTFCHDCVTACRSGALDGRALAAGHAPWSVVAVIGSGCLAESKVMCRSCGDHCAPRAVRFRLVVGGAAMPEIDAARCTGCGACVAACPSGAVRMRQPAPLAA